MINEKLWKDDINMDGRDGKFKSNRTFGHLKRGHLDLGVVSLGIDHRYEHTEQHQAQGAGLHLLNSQQHSCVFEVVPRCEIN